MRKAQTLILTIIIMVASLFTSLPVKAAGTHKLYLDVNFESNWLFDKYDVDVLVDEKKVGNIEHGGYFTLLLDVEDGKHTLMFVNEGDDDVYVKKTLEVKGDMTLQCTIKGRSDKVEISEVNIIDALVGNALEAGNCSGKALNAVVEDLEETGFINISYKPCEEDKGKTVRESVDWTVIDQNIAPDAKVDKTTEIVLTCRKTQGYLDENYLKLNVLESQKIAKILHNKIELRSYITRKKFGSKFKDKSEKVKKRWIIKEISNEEFDDGKVILYFVYTGKRKMPDVTGMSLADAEETLGKAYFSNIHSKSNNGDSIWLPSNWEVIGQNIEAGTSVKATKKIVLTCRNYDDKEVDEEKTEKKTEEKTEKKTEKSDSVSYSTNTKKTVKNGNSGVYAYERRMSYSIYYIIDFDEGYVYRFVDGDGDSTCDRLKIDSGTLNDVVKITYHDGGDEWSEGLHFKYMNQPDHLILEDSDHFQYDFYTTNLADALKIRDTKTIHDY